MLRAERISHTQHEGLKGCRSPEEERAAWEWDAGQKGPCGPEHILDRTQRRVSQAEGPERAKV